MYTISDTISRESWQNLVLWTLSYAVQTNNKPAIDLWFEKVYKVPANV